MSLKGRISNWSVKCSKIDSPFLYMKIDFVYNFMMSRNIYNVVKRSIFIGNQTVIPNQVRLYSRWTHRRPARVSLPFEHAKNVNLKQEKIIDLGTNMFNKSKEKEGNKQENMLTEIESSSGSQKFKDIKKNKEIKLKKKNLYLSQKKVFDDNNEIIYEKVKDNDGRVSTLLVRLKSKKERQRSQQMLVEGWRMIVDGLEAKCHLKYILFSRVEDLQKLRAFLPRTGVLIYKVPYKELQLWSDVETSSGIFGTTIKQCDWIVSCSAKLFFSIPEVRINVPGCPNTAKGVFETPSVNNIKRQSKPIPLQIICDNIRVPGNLGGILRAAVGAGCEKVLLTKGCVDLWDPKVVRSASGAHFRLPVYTSLDWDQILSHLPDDTSLFIADSNVRVDDHPESQFREDMESHYNLPVVPYYSVDFSQLKYVTLIIGGETEGVSPDSYSLAESKNGIRLNIPLDRGVDSLNTGMAAAVIAFEIKKQYIQYWTKLKLEKQAIITT